MTSEWQCSACSSTFSRPEHLKRHTAASHDRIRPHACLDCGNSFNRKDVLRRHERTCPSRVSVAEENNSNDGISDDRCAKRRRSSFDASSTSDPTQGQIEPAKPSDPTIDGIDSEPQDHSSTGVANQLSIMQSLDTNNLPGMSYQLDFPDLDSILFPTLEFDTLVSERLDHLSFFTSSLGMASFADRQVFESKQRLACDAYEDRMKTEKSCPKADISPSYSKLHQKLVQNIQATIINKKGDDVIKINWSSSASSCTELFSPQNIPRFLDYFWSLWYPHCPIIHRPLFDADSAIPPLLCVMVVIGACLSAQKSDRSLAKEFLDTAEELVFSHEFFHIESGAHFGGSSRKKERIQLIQAAYLVSSLQKREGSEEAQGRMRRYRHTSMVALVRNIGPRNASHRDLPLEEATLSWWQQFAEEEELIRTITFVFLIDAALIILHNSPPRMLISELRMDVVCPEASFQAESAAECLGCLRVWASTRFWKHRLSVVSVVRRICQSPIDDSLVHEFSQLGTFNLFTIVQSIHSLMFHLHNSLTFESTMAPVQTGLENWRRVWIERVPEDEGLPETAQNLWKQVGFLERAAEFWQLARIMADKMVINSREDDFEASPKLSRYDHTDMGEVNELIKEYRMLNLGVE